MGSKAKVVSYASIRNGMISLKDRVLFHPSPESFDDFMDFGYRSLNTDYPKFHKMDKLSKLGFLTAEVLLSEEKLPEKYSSDMTGLVISNRSSSLDTDIKYYNQLSRGIASPAVFVYTLPNIMIGEICIRHQLKGESVFFCTGHFDVEAQVRYMEMLFRLNITDACIGGWVELMNDTYESFLYLVTREEATDESKFTPSLIRKLYKSK
jgi:hypothetical protein